EFLERRIFEKNQGTPSKLQVDITRIRSIADVASSNEASTTAATPDDSTSRVALIRAPRERTNKGRNPESRRYVRGVLHPHPYQLVIGAILTLVVMVALPLALAAACFLMLSDLKPE